MKRVGVIGGGQLAWMMAGAAEALDVQLVVQTPSPNDPAVANAQLGRSAFKSEYILAPIDDAAATAQMAACCDVITFENEFVNLEALLPLAAQGVCFRPGLEVLAPLLDKYNQRCYLQQIGLPVPKFFASDDLKKLAAGKSTELGFPLVLKSRRHGYDGQGTFIINDLNALKHKLEGYFAQQECQFLLEEFIPFERELAVIAARSVDGEIVSYPIVETQQEEQICKRVLVPADISPAVATEIHAIAYTLMDRLQAVGLFGIELFLAPGGKVLINEIAPRTHNSGHFTLDACETSQFEQQLRAICGLPLGSEKLRCARAVMVNLLGYEHAQDDYLAKRQRLEQIAQAHVHWYGKTESRPGRKLGHVTVLLDTQNQQQSEAAAIVQTIESTWYSDQK